MKSIVITFIAENASNYFNYPAAFWMRQNILLMDFWLKGTSYFFSEYVPNAMWDKYKKTFQYIEVKF